MELPFKNKMFSLQYFIKLYDEFRIFFEVTLILLTLDKENHYITWKLKICLLAYLYYFLFFFDKPTYILINPISSTFFFFWCLYTKW